MTGTDSFSDYYSLLLDGAYDCVDRIALRGYCSILQTPGGFRSWWIKWTGSDKTLDNNHLMRMAGRFSRRVRAWGKRRGIPIIDCKKGKGGKRNHKLAEEHLPQNPKFVGVFLVLVSRMPAPVYNVSRYDGGGFHLTRDYSFINHYSFHIMDREWGHITIIVAGHPPFNAWVILNGHEWVERQARRDGLPLEKTGNCFTDVSNAEALRQIADALSAPDSGGRLFKVCERWIYSACLCFGLSTEEQENSGFRYQYSVYQAEYSRNLLFRRGMDLDRVFEGLIDRTRQSLDLPKVKTIFGWKRRPRCVRYPRNKHRPRFELTVETLEYNLTVFKVHFGNLTLKMYSKGERVLRIEAIAHNTKVLRCRRSLVEFPTIILKLDEMVNRFLEAFHCADVAFLDQGVWDELPRPVHIGERRIAGVDIGQPRMRSVLEALMVLALNPKGFTVAELATAVRKRNGWSDMEYRNRHAAYDLMKIRGKQLAERISGTRRHRVVLPRFRTIGALLVVHEKVLKPLVASQGDLRRAPMSKRPSALDCQYRILQKQLREALSLMGIAA